MTGSTRRLKSAQVITDDNQEAAKVEDVLFDDRAWRVRYFVCVLGFIDRTKVLVSPASLEKIDWVARRLYLNISRSKLEQSPPLDQHLPVSKLDEFNHYRYYKWPYYWTGAGTFGIEGFPAPVETPPEEHYDHLMELARTNLKNLARQRSDHLRACGALYGYRLQTLNGVLGKVEDFTVEDKLWKIKYVAVNTGHWWHSKPILVSSEDVESISWDHEEMLVNVSKEKLMGAPYTDESNLGL